MSKEKTPLSLSNPQAILVVLLIVASFVIGVLWTKVQYLEGKAGSQTQVAGTTGANPSQPDSVNPPPPEAKVGDIRPVDDNDHIRGDKNAKVTLVEYSDLECPFCKRFHPTMQQVMKEYAGKVRWVYRHFPLDAIHPKARPAALASECIAGLSGNDKFWEYIDRLFEGSPESLTDDQLKTVATSLGVNSGQFADCLNSKKYEQNIEDDLKDGQTGGITGTPGTIVIDDKGGKKLIPGALPYESVKQIIEDALKS